MNPPAADTVTDTPRSCLHCEAEIPPGGAVIDRSAGEELLFCCRGCLGAYRMITGAGLDDYYRRRETAAAPAGVAASRDEFSDAYLARFIYPAADAVGIDILIDGLRCASCVWLNEKIIASLPGVRDVRVNYATGRARVLFDPDGTTPAAIFARISAAGYRPRPYSPSSADAAYTRERKELLIRFGTALFLTMQLMASSFALYAGLVQGMGEVMRSVMQWFSLAVTTPVIFYSGWPFLRGAWRGIVNRAPGMDLLVAVGALASYLYSIHALLTGGEVYFETAAMIVTLILTGRLLEFSARHRASAGVERLLACAPEQALLLRDGAAVTVETAELSPGDLVLVREGERFPVDGTVEEGESEADESPATGESLPVAKGPGDPVVAGSINLLASLRVRVARPAADSFIARVARLVEEAQQRRAPIQNLADRLSALFVPAVLLLALGVFGWLCAAGAPPGGALMRALAVVVIACPCALGLATPTAVVAGTGAAAGAGIIFRGGDILERLSRVRRALFDKTGTLTEGRPAVTALRPAPGVTEEELLAACAAVESGSNHPLARGIVAYAAQRGRFPRGGQRGQPHPHPDPLPEGEGIQGAGPLPEGEGTQREFLPLQGGGQEGDGVTSVRFPSAMHAAGVVTTPGGGVAGDIDGVETLAGTARFLRERGIAVPDESSPSAGSVIHVARAGVCLGRIVLRDRLRPEAPALVAALAARGIATTLLSGDRPEHVREIAAEAGIAEARGGLLPADKAAFVAAREGEGEPVLMVGDGINDAPALSAASVGCAMAGGTDIALESSSLVLTRPDLARVGVAHDLAVRTMRIIRQNLAWAFVYNLVGIPLAMTGRLTPIHAAAAMALSSLCVVGNSLRLTRPLQHSGGRRRP